MEKTKQAKTIHERYVDALSLMPFAVAPDGTGNFDNAYASLSSIVCAVMPVMTEQGLGVRFPGFQWDAPLDKMMMLAEVFDREGEVLTFKVPFLVDNRANSQAVGSALTYCKRQLFGMIACVSVDKDDDGKAASEKAYEGAVDKAKANRKARKPREPQGPLTKAKLEETVKRIGVTVNVEDFRTWIEALPEGTKSRRVCEEALEAREVALSGGTDPTDGGAADTVSTGDGDGAAEEEPPPPE